MQQQAATSRAATATSNPLSTPAPRPPFDTRHTYPARPRPMHPRLPLPPPPSGTLCASTPASATAPRGRASWRACCRTARPWAAPRAASRVACRARRRARRARRGASRKRCCCSRWGVCGGGCGVAAWCGAASWELGAGSWLHRVPSLMPARPQHAPLPPRPCPALVPRTASCRALVLRAAPLSYGRAWRCLATTGPRWRSTSAPRARCAPAYRIRPLHQGRSII